MRADTPDSTIRARRGPQGRRERGTAIVEFALVFPFLLVLTLCVIDVSRAFWIKNVVTQASREGVRWAVVHPAGDSTGVRTRVSEVTSSANLTLTTCTLDTSTPQYKVTVGCQFDWLYPGLFNWLGSSFTNPVTLTGATVMRKEGF